MKNQSEKILSHMKQDKTISQAEAIQYFDCYRLSSVIQRLRSQGYEIVTHSERNSLNSGSHARYELIKQVVS